LHSRAPAGHTFRIREVAERIREALGESGRLSVLTGAVISAESGIPTYRDQGGLWEEHSLEEVTVPAALARHPDLILRFYDERRRKLLAVAPNPAHLALARLEEPLGGRFALINQNIDASTSASRSSPASAKRLAASVLSARSTHLSSSQGRSGRRTDGGGGVSLGARSITRRSLSLGPTGFLPVEVS
jgi:NAD-dependent SIR2 family protein deacetylase